MDSNHDSQNASQTRRAAIGSLAIVGFIALILIGIATAIYAASFLPKVFSQLSTANVYLSTLVQPAATTTPAADASIPLSPAPATTTAHAAENPTASAPSTPTYAPPPSYTPTYTPVAVPVVPSYYGLPDLVTTITSVGYLTRSGDTSSFVSADSAPRGYQAAVRFVIANRGTNVASSWTFRASLPTGDSTGSYYAPVQRALNPGDSIVYTLGFDSTERGNESVRVTADPNRYLSESDEGNDTDTATIYLSGDTSYGSGSYDSNGNYCPNGTYHSGSRYYCQGGSASGNGQYDSNGNYCTYGTYYQNGRYYCQSSYNGNSDQYDSNGNYCAYGTYYQNGRYYCDSSNGNGGSANGHYDSNGNYCTYGTYYQDGRYYCDDPYSNSAIGSYDSNGNYCQYGTYYQNGRYYCN